MAGGRGGRLEPSPAAGLLSCLAGPHPARPGRAHSLGRAGWEQTSCPKATSPLCRWGQGLGTGMCWGLAAFLVWKENTPFPGMLFVSHAPSLSAACGARRGQTLLWGALSPCLLTVLLKCP